MEQLKENIDKISKKFGVVIFIVIIFLVFIYNHNSSQINNSKIIVPTVTKQENNKENLVAKVTKICDVIKKNKPVYAAYEYYILNGILTIKKTKIICDLLEQKIEDYMKIADFNIIIEKVYNYLFVPCKICKYINYYKNIYCDKCNNIIIQQQESSDSSQISDSPQESTSLQESTSFAAASHTPLLKPDPLLLKPDPLLLKKDKYLSDKTDISISDDFWKNIFLPMYKIFIRMSNEDLKKIFKKNPIDGTCGDRDIPEKTKIFLLECDYVFWKNSSNPSFISIKKKNQTQNYSDISTRFDDTVGISNSSYDSETGFIIDNVFKIRYKTPNIAKDDSTDNKKSMDSQFKIPIYELYEKLVLKNIQSSESKVDSLSSKDSTKLHQTTYKEQDFKITSKFWTNIFVPVYNAILQNEHHVLQKINNSSKSTCDIYLLDCGYFFCKDTSRPNCINIKKKTFDQYINILCVYQIDEKYHVMEDQIEVTKINKQFKEPIIELYHKLCKVLCFYCKTFNNSNLTDCNNCNNKIQVKCSLCGFLIQVIHSFCNNCDEPFNKLYTGGFLLYYKNKKNYKSLNI